MKKIILLFALLFSFYISAAGQSEDTPKTPVASPSPFEHEDKCGSPEVESMVWMTVDGKVIRVVDGDTIIVQTKDNKRKRVNLVAIDTTGAMIIALMFLSERVLNRSVSVWVNPSTIESSTVVGVVHVEEKDINREMLEAGIVKYRTPEAYSVSDYTACVYRIVEGKARETKTGLWWPNGFRQL